MIDDAELWIKIVAGDREAFERWYRQSAPRLRVFLRHTFAGGPAVDDVLQETYAQVWRSRRGFGAERGSLAAWLFGIARKQAASWRRRQKPEEGLEWEPAIPDEVERSSMVTDALSRLSEEGRMLLWLREVEGQTYQELSAILDLPVTTVRSRLHAAREAMRRLWQCGQQNPGGNHELH